MRCVLLLCVILILFLNLNIHTPCEKGEVFFLLMLESKVLEKVYKIL